MALLPLLLVLAIELSAGCWSVWCVTEKKIPLIPVGLLDQ